MGNNKASPDVKVFGLGGRLNARTVPNNPWPGFLEMDAILVLQAISPDNRIDFTFTESMMLQAGANTRHRIILVSGALADMMCRLCAAVVGAGMFIKFGNPEVKWSPELVPPETVADALGGGFFHWSDAYAPWRADPERLQLFVFLLVQVHRFVVLHEAAHIVHGHGVLRADGSMDTMIDGESRAAEEEAGALDSQARELVADAEAFHLHFRLLEHEFSAPDLDPMRELLAQKLVPTPRERLRATLLSAFMVFQLLDRRRWSLKTARLSTHPPAPFRLKAIYGAALKLKHPEIDGRALEDEVLYSSYLGSAVVDIGLNRLPQLHWLRSVEGEEFDELFARIHARMSNWAGASRIVSGLTS